MMRKNESVILFFGLCAAGLVALYVFISFRGWFRSHLPADPVNSQRVIGHAQFTGESTWFDTIFLYLLCLSPVFSGLVTSMYRTIRKDTL